jgi:(p)ppGpp synthase/HD superfamily hydrolase
MDLTPRFAEALRWCFEVHQSQRRKGSNVPYVSHLLGVAAIALEFGASEDEAVAALLHDAVEDQGGAAMRQQILDRFGPAVTEIVDGCTDADTTPKPPWRARKEAYLARLPGESSSVHLVSAADKLHNVRSLIQEYRAQGESLWRRFNGGRDGTLWYYRAVADALKATRDHASLVDELDCAVSALEQLAAGGN